MHHKRNRTTRREVKRIDAKAYRAAEAEALRRGVADAPAHDYWHKAPPLPLGDVASTGKGARKRSHKKEKCPVGGTHSWIREWHVKQQEHSVGKPGYWSCPDCTNSFMDGWTFCPRHERVLQYEYRERRSICLECGVERVDKKSREPWRRYWLMRIPKREVRF